MNSPVRVVWAAQGSKEKNQKFFLGYFFQLLWAKGERISFLNIVAFALKSCHNISFINLKKLKIG